MLRFQVASALCDEGGSLEPVGSLVRALGYLERFRRRTNYGVGKRADHLCHLVLAFLAHDVWFRLLSIRSVDLVRTLLLVFSNHLSALLLSAELPVLLCEGVGIEDELGLRSTRLGRRILPLNFSGCGVFPLAPCNNDTDLCAGGLRGWEADDGCKTAGRVEFSLSGSSSSMAVRDLLGM
jgi:hypothetical protein